MGAWIVGEFHNRHPDPLGSRPPKWEWPPPQAVEGRAKEG